MVSCLMIHSDVSVHIMRLCPYYRYLTKKTISKFRRKSQIFYNACLARRTRSAWEMRWASMNWWTWPVNHTSTTSTRCPTTPHWHWTSAIDSPTPSVTVSITVQSISTTVRLGLFVKLEALGQCMPPPRHVLPVSRYVRIFVSGSLIRIATKI